LSESEGIEGRPIPGVTVVDPEILHKVSTDAAAAGTIRIGGTVGAIAGLMAAGAAFKAVEPDPAVEAAEIVGPAPGEFPGEFPAEYEPAPEGSLEGVTGPTPEPAPGGGYTAIYEAPGVEFAPEVTDGYQGEYEPAPTPTAEPAPAEFPAEYEPAPKVAAGGMPVSAAGVQPESVSRPASDRKATDRCPWCSAVAPVGATHCPTCNASLAERDSLGDVLVPGVTGVDPALAHRNDALRSVMAVPGAKLFPTLGFGLAMVASIQQQAERQAESRRPIGALGVPSAEALQVAAQLDRSGPTMPEPAPAAEQDPPSEPAPVVDAWANVPWAGTADGTGTADGPAGSKLAEPATPEPEPEPEPWEDPSLAALAAAPPAADTAAAHAAATPHNGNMLATEAAAEQTSEPVPDEDDG
jgi:hypothetical protein